MPQKIATTSLLARIRFEAEALKGDEQSPRLSRFGPLQNSLVGRWLKTLARLPRIVSVNTYPAWPALSGGRQRLLNIYSQLAKRADVTLVCFDYNVPNPMVMSFSSRFRQHVIKPTPEQYAADVSLQDALCGVPGSDVTAIDLEELNPAFGRAVKSAVAGADLVIADHPYCFNTIRKVWSGPLVYSSHNVEALMKESLLPDNEAGRGALRKVAAVEAACSASADRIFVVSEGDKAEIERRYRVPGGKIIVVPNGANLPRHPVFSREERLRNAKRIGLEHPTAIFLGGAHGPNVAGALAVREIARQVPTWQFLLIGGASDDDAVRAKAFPSNVLALGELSRAELLTVMAAADVGLNPIETGGGTNLKILDYAANGLVVITTPFGNRGIHFRDGEQCLVRAIPDFPDGLLELAAAEDRLEQMGRAGFEHVRQTFLWEQVVESIQIPPIPSSQELAPERDGVCEDGVN